MPGDFYFKDKTEGFYVWFALGGVVVRGKHSFPFLAEKNPILCTHLALNAASFVGWLLFGQVGKFWPTLGEKKTLGWHIWPALAAGKLV